MREYKFRTWDNYHQEMINWEQYKYEMVADDFISNGKGPLTIMEWTGLIDRNGEDLYTGDIVIVGKGINNTIDGVFQVKLSESDGSFLGFQVGGPGAISLNNANVAFKIIGNVFENPELMKGRQ